MPISKERIHRYIRTRLVDIVVACIICSLLGLLGKWHWGLDLFSHFRVQYMITLLCSVIALLFFKQIRWACIGGTTAILLGSSLVVYIPREQVTHHDQPTYSLLSYNLNTANQKYQEVHDFIHDTDADIVFLMEVNNAWIQKLKTLESAYPHFKHEPRSGNFGLALYSKHPIQHATTSAVGPADIPTLLADIQLSETNTLNLIGVHTLPPVSKDNSFYRTQQLSQIAKIVQSSEKQNQIVAGDLNCTPWSFIFKEFTAHSGLHDSSLGNGISGTWFRKLGFISIPIDHVFGNKNITFTSKEIMDTFGSDHNAILTKFQIAPTNQE